jgi:glycerol kinase
MASLTGDCYNASMVYLLSLDQGTTSSRAIVFDDGGNVVATAQREFRQYYPQPGWVEHDPNEIASSQFELAVEALRSAGIASRDICGLGITNQRETVVVWDRTTGQPIYPAIVWQDRRTASACDRLRAEGREAMIRDKTGLLLDPYFSATKLAWILEHVPNARKSAASGRLACGTIDSWLVYRLTAGRLHITDVSNASRTLLLNIETGEWDQELLDCFGVPRSMFPEVRSSSEVYGEVAEPAELRGIPIGGIAGDQQAALFGQACYRDGATKNTYGTGCFMLMNTGTRIARSQNRLLTTIAWKLGGTTEYALEGGVFVGGAVVAWLRDGLGIIKHSSDVEALAGSVTGSGGVVVVPAFAGLGAPHWDPYARGAIVGLTRGTTAAHIARAALESIAFQVADLLDAMGSDVGRPVAELRVDGGASVNNLLLQLQADILQAPIVRPRVTETTALGAAYLAGLTTGAWPNRDAIAAHWYVDRRFEPLISQRDAMAMRARWQEAVEHSKGWAKHE